MLLNNAKVKSIDSHDGGKCKYFLLFFSSFTDPAREIVNEVDLMYKNHTYYDILILNYIDTWTILLCLMFS